MQVEWNLIYIAENHKSQYCLRGLYNLYSRHSLSFSSQSGKEQLTQKNILTGKHTETQEEAQ